MEEKLKDKGLLKKTIPWGVVETLWRAKTAKFCCFGGPCGLSARNLGH
jgi:hypothetical protein